MYSVYVLRNEAGQHDIGLSEDPLKRLNRHNAGESKWTKGRGPWSLCWVREGLPLSEARRLENELERQKGGEGFYRLTGLNRGK